MEKIKVSYEKNVANKEKSLDIRERIEKSGSMTVADYELVAAILGTGGAGKEVRTLSREILSTIDFSSKIPEVDALASISGLGKARACRLIASFELGKRFYGVRERKISCPEDAWHLVRHFDDKKQERFICCTLNGAHDVIAVRVVTVGLINRTIVHPREIYAEALADRACAILVAHNHPSGRLDPSVEDIEITKRLSEAGKILGISLLDHIVFSHENFLSMVDKGIFSPR